MDKGLGDNFSKGAIQMKAEQMKVRSASLTMGQQRPVHIIWTGFTQENKKRGRKNKAGVRVWSAGSHVCSDEKGKRCRGCRSSKTFRIELPWEPTVFLLGKYPKELKAQAPTVNTDMLAAAWSTHRSQMMMTSCVHPSLEINTALKDSDIRSNIKGL